MNGSDWWEFFVDDFMKSFLRVVCYSNYDKVTFDQKLFVLLE